MITRRQLLRGALAASASGLGAGLYTWQVEPHWLEIVERPLRIHGLPPVWAGLRLAFLSDLHIGPQVDDGYLLKTFARVRELAPDLVAYGGDFVSYEADGLAHAGRLLPHLPKGRLGTVGIFGNHDYGPAWAHPEMADALAVRLVAAGITLLRNRQTEIAGLTIVGMDDLWGQRFDPVRAFAGWEAARPTLVLSHNPDTVDLPGWESFRGTILAGHTHGGQCKPPFLSAPLLPVRNRRYTAGEIELAGDRRLYISRGVGHLLKVRFNVRPEVTLFELAG